MADIPVTNPRTRDDPPALNDQGMVVRPIGPIGPVTIATATTDGTNTVAVSNVSVQLLAANPARVNGGGYVVNNSQTTILFVRLGTPATTDFVPVFPNGTLAFDGWSGPVTAIRAVVSIDTATAAELLP